MATIDESQNKPRVILKCVKTGEVAPLQTWARKIAAKRGATAVSVAGALGIASKFGHVYLGHKWERV